MKNTVLLFTSLAFFLSACEKPPVTHSQSQTQDIVKLSSNADLDPITVPDLLAVYSQRLLPETADCKSQTLSHKTSITEAQYTFSNDARKIVARIDEVSASLDFVTYRQVATFSDIEVMFDRNFERKYGFFISALSARQYKEHQELTQSVSLVDLTGAVQGTEWIFHGTGQNINHGKVLVDNIDMRAGVRFEGCSKFIIQDETFETRLWTVHQTTTTLNEFTGENEVESITYHYEYSPELDWHVSFTEGKGNDYYTLTEGK